jgi:hypothetical protein
MNRPTVSIVMPVRNGEAYLAGALSSVLMQLNDGFEIVVIDDGSTDRSREIVEAASRTRPGCIRVIDGPQNGVAQAMNAGIEAARGRYFARCDCDDVFRPGRLVQQLDLLEKKPEYGAVCGRFEILDPEGAWVQCPPSAGFDSRELTQDLRHGRVAVHFCTYLAEMDAIRATGGFRRFFVTGSDIDFQLLLGEQIRVWYEPTCWYSYRLHDASITHTYARTFQKANEATARWLQEQRAERGDPANVADAANTIDRVTFGLDDLQLGRNVDPPAVEFMKGPSAKEQAWQMRWYEAWRQHGSGRRLQGLHLALRATARQPLRGEAWRGLGAMSYRTLPRPLGNFVGEQLLARIRARPKPREQASDAASADNGKLPEPFRRQADTPASPQPAAPQAASRPRVPKSKLESARV